MSRYRREQIRGLVDRGWRVTAIADYRRGEDFDVRALGAQTVHVPSEGSSLNPWENALYLARLTNLLRRLKPDLVHCFSVKAMMAGSAAARLAGIRAVVGTLTGQGILGANGMPVLKALVRQISRAVLPDNAIVIFQNRDDRMAFIDAGMVAPERAVHIPGCGVDVNSLACEYPGIRTAPTTFIHASRMLRSKGVLEFCEAARHVRALYPEAQFIMFGGSAEDYPSKNPDFIPRADLEEMTADAVDWRGRVAPETVEAALRSPNTAAAVLLSRYAEGVPRFLIEAAACGLPIITTNHPGCRDVVEHLRSGYLCRTEPSEVLVTEAADAMLQLLRNPGMQLRMGTQARRVALRFDAERVVADTLMVYDRAMG